MSLIFNHAEEGYPDKLDLFSKIPVQTGIVKSEFQSYGPIAAIRKNAPIEFSIPGSSPDYICLGKSRIALKVKIVKSDGTNIDESDHVALVSNPCHSLFREVHVGLQQINLTSGVSSCYAHKAYIDALIGDSDSISMSSLQTSLFIKDTAAFITDFDAQNASNSSLIKRYRYTSEGKICTLESEIPLDICRQPKLIPNGVDLSFKFFPQTDSFCLLTAGAEKYQVEIVDAKMKICKCKINEAVLAAHAEAFKVSNALYPYPKDDVKSYSIPAGLDKFSLDDVILDTVPERLVVCMTSADGFSGNYRKNPFNFRNNNLSLISFSVDGKSCPSDPIETNFESLNFAEAYLTLYPDDSRNRSTKYQISYMDYGHGYTIIVFHTSGQTNYEGSSLLRKGHTRLQLCFRAPLVETTTVILYSTYQGILEIDAARNVIV